VGDLFGERLRALREAAGLTQTELGKKAGVSQNAISNLEAGKRQPQWAVVVKLARALGVATDAFVEEDGDPALF
jgi:transcriptional regulator with XRE-family HTH domain